MHVLRLKFYFWYTYITFCISGSRMVLVEKTLTVPESLQTSNMCNWVQQHGLCKGATLHTAIEHACFFSPCIFNLLNIKHIIVPWFRKVSAHKELALCAGKTKNDAFHKLSNPWGRDKLIMKLPQQRFLRLLCRQPLLPPQSLTTHTHRCTHTHWQPQFSFMQQRKHHKGNYYASLFVNKGRNAFHVSFRSLCHFQQIGGSWMCYCCEAWLIAAGASESSFTHMHQLRAIWSQLIRAGKIEQKTGLCSMRNGGSCVLHVGLVCAYKSTHALQGLDPDHRQT